jgi:hypothetical protein
VSVALTLSDEDSDESYVRGGAGFAVSGRTVARWCAAVLLASLLATTAVLFSSAAHESSLRSTLQRRGVPVSATVTSCVGIVGGTGVTATSFQCRAAVVVGGHRYVDSLRGTSAQYDRGQAVPAVVDPRHLSVLFTATSVAGSQSTGHSYVSAIVWLAVTIAFAVALALWWRKT